MQQLSEASEARHALPQQYLRRECTSSVSQIAQVSKSDTLQAPSSTEAHATLIQSGNERGLKATLPFFFLHGYWTGNATFCYSLAHELGVEQSFYTLDTYDFSSHAVLPQPQSSLLAAIARGR